MIKKWRFFEFFAFYFFSTGYLYFSGLLSIMYFIFSPIVLQDFQRNFQCVFRINNMPQEPVNAALTGDSIECDLVKVKHFRSLFINILFSAQIFASQSIHCTVTSMVFKIFYLFFFFKCWS